MSARQSHAIRLAKLNLLELQVRDDADTPESRRASEIAFADFKRAAERRYGSVAGAPTEVRQAIQSHEFGAIERAASWGPDAA
jgi:hypothetical protein